MDKIIENELEFPIDDNPAVITKIKSNGRLEVTTTYTKPEKKVKIYDIAELKKKIKKLENAKQQWVDKIQPIQAIIDEYEEMK